MPDPDVYFVKPLSMALVAALIIFFGVLKSGCPALKFITSTPCDFNLAALVVISSVNEGLIFFDLSDNLAII